MRRLIQLPIQASHFQGAQRTPAIKLDERMTLQTPNLSANVDRMSSGSQSFSESQFDPMDRLGTRRIPFEDPFCSDLCELQASSSFSFGDQPWTMSRLNPIQVSPFPEPQHTAAFEPNERITLQPSQSLPDTQTNELPESVMPARTERIRLTPDQAIHIYCQIETKTTGTATLLATEYGVTSKAIRDIWTRRSWAQDTRPYWID